MPTSEYWMWALLPLCVVHRDFYYLLVQPKRLSLYTLIFNGKLGIIIIPLSNVPFYYIYGPALVETKLVVFSPVTFPVNRCSVIFHSKSVIPAQIVIEGKTTISPIYCESRP